MDNHNFNFNLFNFLNNSNISPYRIQQNNIPLPFQNPRQILPQPPTQTLGDLKPVPFAELLKPHLSQGRGQAAHLSQGQGQAVHLSQGQSRGQESMKANPPQDMADSKVFRLAEENHGANVNSAFQMFREVRRVLHYFQKFVT